MFLSHTFDEEETFTDTERTELSPVLFKVPVESNGPGFLFEVETYK